MSQCDDLPAPRPAASLLSAAEREAFILRHRPLVYHYVRTRYGRWWAQHGEDLCAAGLLGLVRAAQRYDRSARTGEGKPVAESTWVCVWVKKECLEYLRDKVHAIRVPAYIDAGRRAELQGRLAPLSLDDWRTTTGSNQEGHDHLPPDPKAADPASAGAADARALVREGMRRLTGRERDVLRWRRMEGLSLKDCGERLGCSRERVRQIERQALDKMRRALEGHGDERA